MRATPGELVDGAHSDALNCIDLELLSFASEDVDISAQVLGWREIARRQCGLKNCKWVETRRSQGNVNFDVKSAYATLGAWEAFCLHFCRFLFFTTDKGGFVHIISGLVCHNWGWYCYSKSGNAIRVFSFAVKLYKTKNDPFVCKYHKQGYNANSPALISLTQIGLNVRQTP